MAHLENKIAEIADPSLRKVIADEVAKLKQYVRFGHAASIVTHKK